MFHPHEGNRDLENLSSGTTNYADTIATGSSPDLTVSPGSPVNTDWTWMVSRTGDMSHKYKAQVLWSTTYFCPLGGS